MTKKLELFSVCINKDNTQVFPSLYDFFLCCKWTQAYGQCQMWYSEAPEWVGCAIFSGTFLKQMTQTTGFVIPFMPCLQSTYQYLKKRVSSKLQQAVLWKLNLNHCQISGYCCAQCFLPWQIALLRHWCPLQPRTYVRVDSQPSLAWKVNTATHRLQVAKANQIGSMLAS